IPLPGLDELARSTDGAFTISIDGRAHAIASRAHRSCRENHLSRRIRERVERVPKGVDLEGQAFGLALPALSGRASPWREGRFIALKPIAPLFDLRVAKREEEPHAANVRASHSP